MATNGYFQIGYGAKSVGMAGAAVANPQDTLAAAANPAGMAWVGERWDLGLRLFSPNRDASINCAGVGGCTRTISAESDEELFLIPDGGFVRRINDKMFAGVSVYGNGGINTNYPKNLYAAAFADIFFGTPAGESAGGTLGVDLVQLMIAPTLTYNLNKDNTLGISPTFAIQRFRASGLGVFAPLSEDPVNLSNNGFDYSYGVGVRIGWLGQISESLKLGASIASKTYMTDFDDYGGLFAEGGAFDIPANFAVGLAVEPTDKLTIAFDVQRILYGDVDSISNPGPSPAELTGAISPDRRLGASNGIGFGWQSTWNYKFGVRYAVNPRWTLRAGYNRGESPIPDNEVLINIVAPGVVEDHVTAGLSYRSSEKSEWTLSYMHAFLNSQRDPMTSLGAAANISMYENALNIGYSRSFD